MEKLLLTPSQTVGPYFAYGLTSEQYNYDFKQLVNGQMDESDASIIIRGQVFDGNGDIIPDAMIEIWDNQNNLFGRYGTGTDHKSRFIFQTLKPKSINNNAPFLDVIVFMRGQLLHSYTRFYFSDEEYSNSRDEVLNGISEERRKTLIAKKVGNAYEIDIHMQGPNETVFFDI